MKKIVAGVKDNNGVYISVRPNEEPTPATDVSIDDLLKSGLEAIRVALAVVRAEINMKSFERDTIMNLKDILAMLRELKKDEKDFLSKLTDEELEKLTKK